jgi:hypothetical protein
LRTVESPIKKSVGSAGLAGRGKFSLATDEGAGAGGGLVWACPEAARKLKPSKGARKERVSWE